MRIRRSFNSILTAFSAALLWTGPLWNRPVLAEEPDENVVAECSFDPNDSAVILPVDLEHKPYRVGLATRDTSRFCMHMAEKLRKHPDYPDIPGGETLYRAAPQSEINGLTIQYTDSFVRCESLRDFGIHFTALDGAIGLEVLARHVVQIDFDHGKVRLLSTVPPNAGEKFEILSLQQAPRRCEVVVVAKCGAELPELFFVDLERPDSIYVRTALFDRLTEKRDLRGAQIESNWATDNKSLRCTGLVNSFALGRLATKDVRAVLSEENIIGLGYLSRYTVTFNFPGGTMYLRPGKHFDRRDRLDFSGIMAGWSSNKLVLGRVPESSPAAVAGLQRGDAVLEVDGITVNRQSVWSIRRILQEEGRTVRVRFKRDDAEKTVDLLLDASKKALNSEDELQKELRRIPSGMEFRRRHSLWQELPLPEVQNPDDDTIAPGESVHLRSAERHKLLSA